MYERKTDVILDMKINPVAIVYASKNPQFSDDDHDDDSRFEVEEPQRRRRHYELFFSLSFLEDLVKRIYRLVFLEEKEKGRDVLSRLAQNLFSVFFFFFFERVGRNGVALRVGFLLSMLDPAGLSIVKGGDLCRLFF